MSERCRRLWIRSSRERRGKRSWRSNSKDGKKRRRKGSRCRKSNKKVLSKRKGLRSNRRLKKGSFSMNSFFKNHRPMSAIRITCTKKCKKTSTQTSRCLSWRRKRTSWSNFDNLTSNMTFRRWSSTRRTIRPTTYRRVSWRKPRTLHGNMKLRLKYRGWQTFYSRSSNSWDKS